MQRQKIRRAVILISFIFFPAIFYLFSPALILFGASQGIVVGSFIAFATLFVVSLLLGRIFCGWLCGAGGFQEACFPACDRRIRSGWIDRIKYFIWVPWVAAIAVLFVRAGGIFLLEPFFWMKHGLSLTDPHSYLIFFVVMGIIVSLALALGRRGFCHSACWISPFMIVGSRIGRGLKLPQLHLAASSGKCTACERCTKCCPMSLDVGAMVRSGSVADCECILCGMCVDICPADAIRYRFSVRRHPPQTEEEPVQRCDISR